MRGSLSTNSRLSPNSSSSRARARSRNASATEAAYQAGSKGRQSCHSIPVDLMISWFRTWTGQDSQKPVGLFPGTGSFRLFGKSHPMRLSTLATHEVPLRCIPATRIAVLFPDVFIGC